MTVSRKFIDLRAWPWTSTIDRLNTSGSGLKPKHRQLVVIEPDQALRERVDHEVDMTWRQGEELKLRNEYLDEMPDRFTSKFDQYRLDFTALGQQFAVDKSRMRHELAIAKIPAVLTHVQTLLRQGCRKLVVMAQHDEVIKALKAQFPSAAMSVEGTDAPHRQLQVARFQNEPECTLFVESLELTDWRFDLTVASHVVFAEQDWVPGRMAEAEDRCFKVAQQKEGLTIQMLVFAGSLDLKRCMAMSGTRQVVTLQAT